MVLVQQCYVVLHMCNRYIYIDSAYTYVYV